MAYRAPGVYVTDKYVERTEAPAAAKFLPAIVGVPRKVYENFDTKETVSTADPSTETTKDIDLSSILTDFDTIADVAVYLVPAGQTLSQKYFNKFLRLKTPNQQALEFPATYVMLKDTAIIRGNKKITIKISTSNVASGTLTANVQYAIFIDLIAQPTVTATYLSQEIQTSKWTYDSSTKKLTITLGVNNLKVPSGSDPIILEVSQDTTTETYNITDATSIIDPSNGVIQYTLTNTTLTSISTVKLTYKLVNPIFQGISLCASAREIEDVAGPVSPLNPFAYSAYLALTSSVASNLVALVPIPDVTNENVQNALGYIDTQDAIYAVTFAFNAKQGSWLDLVNTWLNQYEQAKSTSVPRIAFVGFESFADYGNTSSPSLAANELSGFAQRYEQKRLRILANPVLVMQFAPKDLTGSASKTFEFYVPGYVWGGVYIGTVHYVMENGSPDYSFTLKPAANVSKLFFPNGQNTEWFTYEQLNKMTTSGLWVLVKRPGTETIVTRHAVTTAETKYSTFDDSTVRIVDYIMLDLRNLLNNMVGNVRLDTYSINTIIAPRINEKIKSYVEKKLAVGDTKLISVKVDPTNRNVLLVDIQLQVAGTMDVIEVSFTVL